MSETAWRRLAIGLAIVLVVLVVFGGVLLLAGGGGTTGPSATESPSESPSASSSESASPSLSPSPSASPTKTPIPTSPTTTLTFFGLKLDATADAASQVRTIAFASAGPGSIVVTAKVTSPQTQARVCLRAGTQTPTCQVGGGTLSFKGTATSVSGQWSVTAIGDTITTPTLDLTITWPAKAPKVTLTNFRFDGTTDPDYNGFTVGLKARTDGALGVDFSWGSKALPYDLLVQDQTDPSKTQEPTGTGTSVALGVPGIKDHQYRVTLQNTSSVGAGRVALGGTLAWP